MLEIGIAFDSSGSDKTTAQIIPLLGWVWSRVYDALCLDPIKSSTFVPCLEVLSQPQLNLNSTQKLGVT